MNTKASVTGRAGFSVMQDSTKCCPCKQQDWPVNTNNSKGKNSFNAVNAHYSSHALLFGIHSPCLSKALARISGSLEQTRICNIKDIDLQWWKTGEVLKLTHSQSTKWLSCLAMLFPSCCYEFKHKGFEFLSLENGRELGTMNCAIFSCDCKQQRIPVGTNL